VGITAAALKDTANQFQGVVILLRDLSDVMELRQQVQQMEQLAMLGEMASGIAHEIRNPLAGIKATAQLLADEGGLTPFQSEVVERMIREADKANRRITEFLQFARPNRARPDFHPLRQLVSKATEAMSARLQQAGICLKVQLSEQLPPVFVDQHQLEQVLENLILNAIDAMPNGGQITLTARRRILNGSEATKPSPGIASQKREYLELLLQDNGEGMSREQQEKIFQPYYTTRPQGIGLGLAICTRLMEENRGKIDVVSCRQKGTTMRLALPVFAYSHQ
jgi:signal transduction histidine kinase